MVVPTITSFNISGLTASTGTGEGTILEFDSSGNIIPSAGTYNSVSKIDNAIGAASGICPLDSLTQVSPTYLPLATPTTLGVLYGTLPTPSYVNSSLSLGANANAVGTWSIAIGNDVLTSAEDSTECNVAIGSYNLKNLTTGQFNTAIGQGSLNNLTTGNSNVALGYEAGGGYSTTDGIQTGSNNIAIGNFAASGTNDVACSNNIYIGPSTATSATGVSNSIMLGSGATSGVSNEFMISNIDHLNIPSLTTSTDGTGTLQWGGANVGWVQASGGTYNSVSKIDTIISTIQGQWPAEIIFTTTSTDPPNVTWTVPAGVNSITIEASGSGAAGTPAIATSTSGVYQGGGRGGSGQVGNITIPGRRTWNRILYSSNCCINLTYTIISSCRRKYILQRVIF